MEKMCRISAVSIPDPLLQEKSAFFPNEKAVLGRIWEISGILPGRFFKLAGTFFYLCKKEGFPRFGGPDFGGKI